MVDRSNNRHCHKNFVDGITNENQSRGGALTKVCYKNGNSEKCVTNPGKNRDGRRLCERRTCTKTCRRSCKKIECYWRRFWAKKSCCDQKNHKERCFASK